jgi:hypothetical protein
MVWVNQSDRIAAALQLYVARERRAPLASCSATPPPCHPHGGPSSLSYPNPNPASSAPRAGWRLLRFRPRERAQARAKTPSRAAGLAARVRARGRFRVGVARAPDAWRRARRHAGRCASTAPRTSSIAALRARRGSTLRAGAARLCVARRAGVGDARAAAVRRQRSSGTRYAEGVEPCPMLSEVRASLAASLSRPRQREKLRRFSGASLSAPDLAVTHPGGDARARQAPDTPYRVRSVTL